ncbi:MAG: hypothetical protein WBQ69_10330 [Gallionella sp.]
MDVFGHLFGQGSGDDNLALDAAIDRAISAVDPLLKQLSGYPDIYRKPIVTALEYAHNLAADLPGPVTVDRETYAKDPFVHSLFPSADLIDEGLSASQSLRDFQQRFPASDELYALMGMRRSEKTLAGTELYGQTEQLDGSQKAVYFSSHTIEDPAPTERMARDLAAMSFFDSLVSKVRIRIGLRKQELLSQMQEKDLLTDLLRAANAGKRPALELELSRMMKVIQATSDSLELRNFIGDFEAVMLHPEEHLRMVEKQIILDSMGIKRDVGGAIRGKAIVFSDLIGYDRRDWTVTLVRCNNLRSVSFAGKPDNLYRKLVA